MKQTLLGLIVLMFATPVFAQSGLTGPLFSVSMSPRYPAPNALVKITLQSSVYDLEGKRIVWRGNGEILSEAEESVLEVRAPEAGKSTRITVSVEGTDSVAEITIAPASVALMWEAQTYAPGLYRGRRLPSSGAAITLQALPSLRSISGEVIPSSQIIYTWKRDGQTLGSLSGRGKSSITTTLSPFANTERFSVIAESADKSTGAEAATTIQVVEAPVRLYIDHSLYGTMYHQALGATTFIADTETSFQAIPYFVTAAHHNDKAFAYEWRVNRTTISPNDDSPSLITINSRGTNGRALINLSVTHRTNLLFDGQGEWSVVLGSSGANTDANDPFSGQ